MHIAVYEEKFESEQVVRPCGAAFKLRQTHVRPDQKYLIKMGVRCSHVRIMLSSRSAPPSIQSSGPPTNISSPESSWLMSRLY